MSQSMQKSDPISPPADVPEIQRGNWLALSERDPVVEYIVAHLWDRPEEPASWRVARLSKAAHIYQEVSTGWAVVGKFYAVKTGDAAAEYAQRELERIQRTQATFSEETIRAIRPLSLWRGVLFLEYIDGLRLEDEIAIRRNRPGALTDRLERVAEFLATLHTNGTQSDAQPDFDTEVDYVHKVIGQLAKHGVLQEYPLARQGLERLADRWAASPTMRDFTPALNHGDATTTNFVFPQDGGVVVLDWERLQVADPASDLGRLMAEVTHSIHQHGGSVAEAEPFAQQLAELYGHYLPADWDADALLRRARFYRASSTLRIARNGWISRLDRTALVAQAMALLVD